MGDLFKTARRIGFTGTHRGMSSAQLVAVERELRFAIRAGAHHLHHGDCVGADEQAHSLARMLGYTQIHGHLPIDEKARAFCTFDVTYAAKPYLERNRDIVECADLMIAAPATRHEALRSGTWATVRYARSMATPLFIAYPDGSVEWPET